MTKNAFSLVELSIVLVILGLLVGGVLSGQSLIRAAEMRSISTEFSKFRSATYSFRDKYFAVPGDIANATQFWGVLAGSGSDAICQNTTATGLPTCNGNGDGQVFQSAATLDETYRFWQHLANAGLIEGKYSGVQLGSGPIRLPGVNVPGTRVDQSGVWYPNYTGYTAGTVSAFTTNFGNHLVVRTISSSLTAGAQLLRPEEAWNVDTKFDDGLPGTGMAIALKGNGGTGVSCTSAAGVAPPADAGATYLLTNSSKDCILYFTNLF